jgi:hypothetical protein
MYSKVSKLKMEFVKSAIRFTGSILEY